MNKFNEINGAIQKITKEKDELKEKIGLYIECLLLPRSKQGVALFEVGRRYYNKSIGDVSSSGASSVSVYRNWSIEFLEEAMELRYYVSEVYCLYGHICEDRNQLSKAYDCYSKGFQLDERSTDALESLVKVGKTLSKEGDKSKEIDVGKYEMILAKLG